MRQGNPDRIFIWICWQNKNLQRMRRRGVIQFFMATLQEKYKKEVIPALQAKFGYKNTMAVPRLIKVVVTVGVGRLRDEKERQEVEKYLALITGQKVSPRPAEQAIAAFKTREGLIIGYQVTLRGWRMYDFIYRLVGVALPRTRV